VDKRDEVLPPDGGVFVTKGMGFGIPSFTISVNPDGSWDTSAVELLTEVYMCPHWLEIAYQQLLQAEAASKELLKANTSNNAQGIANALEGEFLAGMQVSMAGCFALDAYYAGLIQFVQIPSHTRASWKQGRTARYKRIVEVIRVAFNLDPATTERFREFLKQAFLLRDWAVHPPAGAAQPSLHPELNKVTDWRYSTFRYANALALAKSILSTIHKTASNPPKNCPKDLREYCDTLSERTQGLRKRWDTHFPENLI
jgi:hypothetical protein